MANTLILNGTRIPAPGDMIWAVRRTVRFNKNGKPYSAHSDTDVELVQCEVSTVTCVTGDVKVGDNEFDERVWWNGVGYFVNETISTVTISPWNIGMNQAEGEERLQFFKENGLNITFDGRCSTQAGYILPFPQTTA